MPFGPYFGNCWWSISLAMAAGQGLAGCAVGLVQICTLDLAGLDCWVSFIGNELQYRDLGCGK